MRFTVVPPSENSWLTCTFPQGPPPKSTLENGFRGYEAENGNRQIVSSKTEHGVHFAGKNFGPGEHRRLNASKYAIAIVKRSSKKSKKTSDKFDWKSVENIRLMELEHIYPMRTIVPRIAEAEKEQKEKEEALQSGESSTQDRRSATAQLTSEFGSRVSRAQLHKQTAMAVTASGSGERERKIEREIQARQKKSEAQAAAEKKDTSGERERDWLPYYNPDTEVVEEIYPYEHLVPERIMNALFEYSVAEYKDTVLQDLAFLKPMYVQSETLGKAMETLDKSEEVTDEDTQQMQILIKYIWLMLKFLHVRNIPGTASYLCKNYLFSAPVPVAHHFYDTFANRDGKRINRPHSLKDRLISHILIAVMHLCGFEGETLSTTVMANALKIAHQKLNTYLREAGCRVDTLKASQLSEAVATTVPASTAVYKVVLKGPLTFPKVKVGPVQRK